MDRYIERDDPPKLRELAATGLRKSYDDAFPPEVRSQVLAVFVRANPEYVDLLGARKAGLRAISDSASEIVKSIGYRSIVVGDEFLPDDYIDQGHLMASGGAKLAHPVAQEVRAMSRP